MKPLITILAAQLIFVLMPHLASGQKNLQPGYVITLSGDTSRGMIDFRNWIQNPAEVKFIEQGTDNIVTYKPGTIRKFEVSNEAYVSSVIHYDKSSVDVEQLGYSDQLEITTDTVFLQVLIGGKKNLYYYRGKGGSEQFFIDSANGTSWLIHKSFMKDIAGATTVMQTNDSYLQQLQDYLQDCPMIKEKTGGMNYKTSDMEKLFRDYYTCSNSSPSFEMKKEKMRFECGVIAGAGITTMQFSATQFDYLSKVDYKSSTGIAGGIFGNIFFKRKLKRLSFCSEFFYNAYKTSGEYKTHDFIDGDVIYYTDFSFSYIKLNNLLRYTIPVNKLSFYVNAGISNGLLLTQKNHLIREVQPPFPSKHERDAILGIRNHEQSYMAGIGARFSRLLFEARYESGNGMSEVAGIGVTVKRLYFLAGFRF